MLFNRPRAIDFMSRFDLDGMVATSPVNVTYFSDYFCWLDSLTKDYMMTPGGSGGRALQSYAVFPRDGDPALIVNPIFGANAAHLWVKDIYFFGSPGLDAMKVETSTLGSARRIFDAIQSGSYRSTPVEALLAALTSRGLTCARIGLEMEGLGPEAREAVVRALPRAEIRDCSNLIRLLRMVKSHEELERLTRAAEINERAAMESLTSARAGCSIAELIHQFRRYVAEEDAEFDHFAFGLRGLGIAMEPDYVLAGDDVLYVDFGCVFRHYFSDGGTTLTLRELSKDLGRRLETLRGCVDAGMGALRPGVRSSAVREEMWRVLCEQGITVSFPHGHGLGLEVRDYPILVSNNGLRIRDDCVDESSDLLLEPDMVVNLESAIFMPGTGSLHIERSFVISHDGHHELVHQDRSRPVMPREKRS